MGHVCLAPLLGLPSCLRTRQHLSCNKMGRQEHQPPGTVHVSSWHTPGAWQGRGKAVSCAFNPFEHMVPFKPDRPGDRHQICVHIAIVSWDDDKDNNP